MDLTRLTDFDIQFADGSGIGVNPYSARGLKGHLRPIDQARGNDKVARTVNGELIDISAPQMQNKLRIELTGNDQAPPAVDSLRVGLAVICASVAEIGVAAGQPLSHVPSDGSLRTEGGFSYYRPAFAARVIDWDINRDEYPAAVGWSLVLEEI